MKNYTSVNAKYYKSSEIYRIYKHNFERLNIDYLLNNEDIKYQNQNDQKGMNLKNVLNDLQQQKSNILNQKCPYKHNKNDNEIVEMVVALSEDQAKHYLDNGINLMDGFDNLSKNIKEKYGFEPMGINLHLDEGHKDKNGVVKLNIHAHLTFFNFDFEKEKTVLRTMKNQDWKDLQTLAETSFQEVGLDFTRGQSKDITKKEHLKRNDFIIQKQGQELEDILNTLNGKQNELKALYGTLNTQKNLLKDISKSVDKNSNLYTILKTNIKNLQQQEKSTRLEHKNLSKNLKDKKDQLKIIDENIEDQDEWLKDTKIGLKDFIKEHTTKKGKTYTINNVNNFYNELVDLSLYLSKFDLKIDEIDKLKDNNILLFDKIQSLESIDNKNIEYIKKLETNVDTLIDKKNDLLEDNYKLKSFIKNKNLDDEYDTFTKEKEKVNDISRDM
ncbi:MAG: hypothetical protein DRG78_16850 [Epsilonproteobacteria bacterium]|nr:MAG: hypothetical protein DRG78_16850 [Campylobacterota bacterium]